MNIDSKQSVLGKKAVEAHSLSHKEEDLLGTLNLENPRIKWKIEYNWQTALLIKHDKKYKELEYSCYSIYYMWRFYDIGPKDSIVKNCIIKWVTKEGIIISYCRRAWWPGEVKWNSLVFDWEKLNKFSYEVDRIVTLDEGEDALICRENGKQYALYDWFKSPDFDAIESVELFAWKLATIWRINWELLVCIWDQVYWKWERWSSVELVWWQHQWPRIEWTKKWEMLIK